jgi:CheY-like chemotaxis protein/glycine cleavage system H lipoate-binding protein
LPGGSLKELFVNEAKQILVIDDEEVIHASLCKILSRQGYEIDNSFTVADAFEKLSRKGYDLIITDLMMPEMTGIELLEELNKKRIAIPFIMITGYPTIKTAVQAIRLGAVDYVTKPFTRQELLSPVNRALRRSAAGQGEGVPAENQEAAEIGERGAGKAAVKPGEKYSLHGHSWAVYLQDGMVEIGVEESFLSSIGEIVEIDSPEQGDLLEQGFKGFNLRTAGGEAHFVFAPVGGRVIETNGPALRNPGSINKDTWLIKILPNQLKQDVALLNKKN